MVLDHRADRATAHRCAWSTTPPPKSAARRRRSGQGRTFFLGSAVSSSPAAHPSASYQW